MSLAKLNHWILFLQISSVILLCCASFCTWCKAVKCSVFPDVSSTLLNLLLFFTFGAGEVFHNLGKEDHRHPTPVAPRNSPTGLTSLPSLTPTPLSPASAPHMPNLVTSPFPKTASTAPGFIDPHSGLCPTSTAPPAVTAESSVSASASVCRLVRDVYLSLSQMFHECDI